ncbi:MAG: hypothetical protein DWQ01_11490 [Planctomycetota bacterium]|nr:MAG: hypothetical protein DWQ01_11490 [Planctomycetota bacterium]
MPAFLSPLLASLGLAAFAAGLADSAALTLGGTATQRFLAWPMVMFGLALGARRADRPGKIGILLPAWLWLLALGLFAPSLAPEIAPWTAGPPRSFPTLLGLLLLGVVLMLPLIPVAAATTRQLFSLAGGSWTVWLLGWTVGLSLSFGVGLGPVGFGAAGLLWLLGAWPRREEVVPGIAQTEDKPIELPWASLVPVFFLAVTAVLGLLYFLPYQELFDGSAAVQDLRRWMTLGFLALAACVTFGAGFAETRGALFWASLFAAATAFGWSLSSELVSHLAEQERFTAFQGMGFLPQFLADWRPQERMTQSDWYYVPLLLIRNLGLPVLLFAAAWRAALGLPGQARSERRQRGRLLAATYAGIGAAWLLWGLWLHPEATPWRGVGAALAAAAAAITCIVALPRPSNPALRWIAGCALALVAVAARGLPQTPNTAVPFFDNFQWQVMTTPAAEGEAEPEPSTTLAQQSLVRALQRQATVQMGRYFLGEGRNYLTPESLEDRRHLVLECLFPLSLTTDPQRVLLVDLLHPQVIQEMRQAGIQEVHWAGDPPEMFRVAKQHFPSWQNSEPDGVYASVAEAPEDLDFIALRSFAPWERSRNLLRPSLIGLCRNKLSSNGVLAMAFDPERCLPGIIGATAEIFAEHFPQVELWLLPRTWGAPRLVLTGRQSDSFPALQDLLKFGLEANGLLLASEEDFPLLRLGTGEDLQSLPGLSLAPPLSRAIASLGATEYRRLDEINPSLRAGALLQSLQENLSGEEKANSFLPFYAAFLSDQIYTVYDTYIYGNEAEKIDVEEAHLDLLLELSRRSPQSRLLQDFWGRASDILVAKREPEWSDRYYGALVDELGWQHPGFHVVLGNAALEMLDPELALEKADIALRTLPDFYAAQDLRCRALTALDRHSEAADGYRQLAEMVADPADSLLKAWATAALKSGDRTTAEKVARRLYLKVGEAGLTQELGDLLGLQVPDDGMVHPEAGG